jgi:hypothetical protein
MKPAPVHLSSVSCPQCRQLVPAPEAMKTPFGPVWKAKHDVYHLEWQITHGVGRRPTTNERFEAWRTYANALEDDANRARRHDRECIFDLDQNVQTLTVDLTEVRAELKDVRDALEQAEADLDHCRQYGADA